MWMSVRKCTGWAEAQGTEGVTRSADLALGTVNVSCLHKFVMARMPIGVLDWMDEHEAAMTETTHLVTSPASLVSNWSPCRPTTTCGWMAAETS